MLTAAQIEYISDVLGGSVNDFTHAPRPQPETTAEVVVLTPELNREEQELLGKILASIQLQNYVVCSELTGQARHVLSFTGEGLGRLSPSHWGFSRVANMIGQTAEVTTAKKETWALLKQFQQEALR